MQERLIYQYVFPEGKVKAFTMSYDDGVLQDRKLVALMHKYGVKGTFNINSGRLSRSEHVDMFGTDLDISTLSPEEAIQLYQGFEIATHGKSHCSLSNLGALGVTEVLEDRLTLEQLFPYLIQGHAYPYGSYNEQVKDVLRSVGIKYARTTTSSHSFSLPNDYLEWNPTCHHGEPELMDLAKNFCETEQLIPTPMLFYLWGHSYEFDQCGNWSTIEDFLSYISEFKNQIWFATNIEIINYMEACKTLELSADGTRIYNPSSIPVWFEAETFLQPRNIHRIDPGKLISL